MEKILKKQTKEQILNDFKKLKDLNYNLEEYVPSFYEDTVNLFQEDIKELERLSSSKDNKVVFLNKLFFKSKNINSMEDFNFFIKSQILKNDNLELYPTFKNRMEVIYNDIKSSEGGMASNLCYYNKEEDTYIQVRTIIGNPYKNPFNTMHTIFHEFCHTLQFKYKKNNYYDLYKKILDKDKILTKEYNNASRDYYINQKYVVETQADLFGYFILLIKALETNNKDIINNTIKEIQHSVLNNTNIVSVFDGYFSYPIIEEFLENKDKLNELENFIDDNKVDFKKLYNFTMDLVLNKQHEYYDSLFKDTEINGDLFNFGKIEDINDFIKDNQESIFVKDCINFKEKQKINLSKISKRRKIESEFSNLKTSVCKFDRYKHDKFKKTIEESINNLQNALNEFEKDKFILK